VKQLCANRDENRVNGCSYRSCYDFLLLNTFDGATVVTRCSPRHNMEWSCGGNHHQHGPDTWLPFANCVFFLLCRCLSHFTTEIVTGLFHALLITLIAKYFQWRLVHINSLLSSCKQTEFRSEPFDPYAAFCSSKLCTW
jgi:hypothetical protein